MTTEPTREPAAPTGPRGRRRTAAIVALAVAAVVLVLGIYSGLRARSAADSTLRRMTEEAAITIVNVVNPKPGAPIREIRLPGTTQAFTDAPIFARTSGYLKRWYFDIGARVKEGQLLAEIDSPEVDQQLQQARAPRAPISGRPRSPPTAGRRCWTAARCRGRRRTWRSAR